MTGLIIGLFLGIAGCVSAAFIAYVVVAIWAPVFLGRER